MACETLALQDCHDLPGEDYYNESYGSFVAEDRVRPFFLKFLRNLRNRIVFLHPKSLLASIILWLRPLPYEFSALSLFSKRDSRILDVGCGSGKYLKELSECGYSNLHGIDPFLQTDKVKVGSVVIRKLSIESLEEQYDVIVSHHSLEHSPDPFLMLVSMSRNLSSTGYLILTVPVLGKLYRQFKEYSYIIQAPQHTFLFTIDGLISTAHRSGLELVDLNRGKEFEDDWIRYSIEWMSRDDRIFEESMMNVFQGEGDNVTFIFKKLCC
jgi:2-polyprenyl-3-methyl-5-hydroxy-6-metoxy-1,4-benzoquinol methylase